LAIDLRRKSVAARRRGGALVMRWDGDSAAVATALVS